MEVNATTPSAMTVGSLEVPLGDKATGSPNANKFSDLLEFARSEMNSVSIKKNQKSELWNSLKIVDHTVRNLDSEIAAAIVMPKPDIASAHLMTMQLEQKTHVAKMMMETSIACAGSLKTTLTQLLKNQ